MQLAHAAPRCASRRRTAVCAIAVASCPCPAHVRRPRGACRGRPDHACGRRSRMSRTPRTARAPTARASQPSRRSSWSARWAAPPASSRAGPTRSAQPPATAGMHVCKVYTPYADAGHGPDRSQGRRPVRRPDARQRLSRTRRSSGHASGAEPNDGNDSTAHGLGLNASHGSSALKYYGATWVSKYLRLAPNGIVHPQPHVQHVRQQRGLRTHPGRRSGHRPRGQLRPGLPGVQQLPRRRPPERRDGAPEPELSTPPTPGARYQDAHDQHPGRSTRRS